MKTTSPSVETVFHELVSRLQQRPPNVLPVPPVPPRPPHVQGIINNLNAQQAAQAVRQAQAANGNGGGNNANNAGGNGGGGGNGGAGGGNNAGNGNQPRGGSAPWFTPESLAHLKLGATLLGVAIISLLFVFCLSLINERMTKMSVDAVAQISGIDKIPPVVNPSAQQSGTARMHAVCGKYTAPQKYTAEGLCFYYENIGKTPVSIPVESVAKPRSIKANFEGRGDVVVTVGGSSCTSTLTSHCREFLATSSSNSMVLQVPPGQGVIVTLNK